MTFFASAKVLIFFLIFLAPSFILVLCTFFQKRIQIPTFFVVVVELELQLIKVCIWLPQDKKFKRDGGNCCVLWGFTFTAFFCLFVWFFMAGYEVYLQRSRICVFFCFSWGQREEEGGLMNVIRKPYTYYQILYLIQKCLKHSVMISCLQTNFKQVLDTSNKQQQQFNLTKTFSVGSNSGYLFVINFTRFCNYR